MKQFISFLFLFAYLQSYSQNTVAIYNKKYETHFDTVLKYPKVVVWYVTKNSITCEKKYPRTNKFIPDPKLYKHTNIDKSYVGSGYDRGHNFAAADAACDSTAMRESFFFSNMTPQHPNVNRGDWKDLEEFTRNKALEIDSIKVWAGSWGILKKIGDVSVPTDCWKVMYIHKTKEWKAYHFKNEKTSSLGIKSREVSLQFIEDNTGLKFKL
jgi:endonuclease G